MPESKLKGGQVINKAQLGERAVPEQSRVEGAP